MSAAQSMSTEYEYSITYEHSIQYKYSTCVARWIRVDTSSTGGYLLRRRMQDIASRESMNSRMYISMLTDIYSNVEIASV
jgi:hypothetical protein